MKKLSFVVVLLVLIAGLAAACVPVPPVQPAAAPGGLTYLSDLEVDGPALITGNTGISGTLAFEGTTANAYQTTVTATDPTADRAITLPNISGSVLLTTNPGKVVFGSNTVTGTLTIAHGLTTPEAAFCDLGADAVANAATCSTAISGSTVTVKTWKADGVTAGSTAVKVDWLVAGQP